MIGPIPPPYGGQSILIQNILESRLAIQYNFRILNISHNLIRHPFYRTILTLRFVARMIRLLFRFPEIGLIHIHTSAGIAFLEKGIYVLLGRVFRKNVILHIHGGRFPLIWNRAGNIEKRFIRHILNSCDSIIVLSQSGQSFFTREIATSSKVFKLPNAIRFRNENRKAPEEEVVFLYVGHLKPEKGLFDLLDAYRECSLLVPGRKISLRLIGCGDNEENEDRIKRTYEASGLAGISFLGIRTGAEKWNEFALADIFILPSHSEDMPVAILEAMACGLPIIATSVGSIPEFIEDNINGYLVSPRQPSALAEKMAFLVRNSDIRQTMGSSNREKVRREFSFEEYERKLGDVYLSFLSN